MTPADARHNLITGHREMDEEHALQIRLLTELLRRLESDDTAAALELFDRVEQFTGAHFLAEELLMRLHAYPEYEAHAAAHASFVEELKAMRTRLADGVDEEIREEADAFARRLLAHIATADHALGEFQRASGIAAA